MKLILFSDIHFGAKTNSEDFNKDCISFIEFMIDYVRKNIKEPYAYCFLGDYFHNRNQTNNLTLDYAQKGLDLLSNSTENNIYMILGNHDLFYKNQLSVSPLLSIKHNYNVKIFSEVTHIDNLLFIPWLVEGQSLSNIIKEYSGVEYVFCHPEIPSFHFNQMITMEGEYHPEDYAGPRRILAGHFHCKDEKNNITYIGNCFSHDFSDNNDWHRKGFTILDTETNELQQIEYPNAPKYCMIKLSQLDKVEFCSNMFIKLINDCELKPEQVFNIQEKLQKLPQVSDCCIIPSEITIDERGDDSYEVENIDNIDSLIINILQDLDMNNIKNTKLIDIYKNLDNGGCE